MLVLSISHVSKQVTLVVFFFFLDLLPMSPKRHLFLLRSAQVTDLNVFHTGGGYHIVRKACGGLGVFARIWNSYDWCFPRK